MGDELYEKGGMIDFSFQESKVMIEMPDACANEDWEITPQQSPCEVHIYENCITFVHVDCILCATLSTCTCKQ